MPLTPDRIADLYAEDQALDDAAYVVDKALAEKQIDLQMYLKVGERAIEPSPRFTSHTHTGGPRPVDSAISGAGVVGQGLGCFEVSERVSEGVRLKSAVVETPLFAHSRARHPSVGVCARLAALVVISTRLTPPVLRSHHLVCSQLCFPSQRPPLTPLRSFGERWLQLATTYRSLSTRACGS